MAEPGASARDRPRSVALGKGSVPEAHEDAPGLPVAGRPPAPQESGMPVRAPGPRRHAPVTPSEFNASRDAGRRASGTHNAGAALPFTLLRHEAAARVAKHADCANRAPPGSEANLDPHTGLDRRRPSRASGTADKSKPSSVHSAASMGQRWGLCGRRGQRSGSELRRVAELLLPMHGSVCI